MTQTWPTGYINKINSSAEWVDTQFNRVNTIPIVGTFTSSVYATASVVHFGVATAFSLIGFMGQITQGKDSDWKLVVEAGTEHMKHAALNYASALGTGFLAGSIIGWMPFLAYQVSQLEDVSKSLITPKENGFKPFIKYGASFKEQFKGYKVQIQTSLDPRNLVSFILKFFA
jgi:hypothetical protein